MLEVTVDSDFVVGDLQAKLDAEPGVAPERWSMRYSVEDAALANFEPMAVLAPILRGVPELRREMTNLGLVVTELFANALDHGVLGLDSAAKNDPAGFMAYFTERQQRLQSVQGRVEIDLSCARENTGVELCLSFTDSGAGFDYEAVSFSERDAGETGGENDSDTNNDTLLHGRGLRLMRQLCSTLEHSNGGRTTRVVFHASRTGGSDG
ncbi:MAG: ATP-binding protein [Pseudomonadota bacterium]